jgi:hypothetical protein
VGASSAIRWLDRMKKQGDVAPKGQGGDHKSGRIEAEADFLLSKVAKIPDIRLVELQEKPQARGVGALSPFFDRRCITLKNKDGTCRRTATRWREGRARGVGRRATRF